MEAADLDDPRPVVYTLLGPTGAGKTALLETLVDLAPDLYEVISCDSRQIYRGLEIGSAAPAGELCARLPHHIVGHVSPAESYSAARFRDEALAAIAGTLARGRIPFLVGGSGFYFRALSTQLFESPGDEQSQAEIRARVGALSPAGRLARLRELDPDALAAPGEPPSAGRVHVNDDYRIGRALEICLGGGPLYSERWRASLTERQTAGGTSAYRFAGWRLEISREAYWPRLSERAAQMVAAGVAEEAGRVHAEFGDCPGLETLGYADALLCWRGKLSGAALRERLFIAHRQYGKRQRTWLRRETSLAATAVETLQSRLRAADGELARLV